MTRKDTARAEHFMVATIVFSKGMVVGDPNVVVLEQCGSVAESGVVWPGSGAMRVGFAHSNHRHLVDCMNGNKVAGHWSSL